MGHISHNEQLVLTSGNVHVYLIQGDVLLVDTGAARGRLLVIGVEKLKFESRPAFIPCEELPNIGRNGLLCLLLALCSTGTTSTYVGSNLGLHELSF